MSDSQSDGIPAELDEAGEVSKVSVSTENDTEADIEEMDSIADYEVPILSEKEAPPEPVVQPKPSPVPNTPKKEPSIESKKEGSSPKVEVSAPKKVSVAPEKSPAPSKESAAATQPPKTSSQPADGLNPKEPSNPSRPLEPVEVENPPAESATKEASVPKADDKPESIKAEVESEKHSESLSKKSNKSVNNDASHTKSKSRHSSRGSQKEQPNQDEKTITDKTPTPSSKSNSERQLQRGSRNHSRSSHTSTERKPYSQSKTSENNRSQAIQEEEYRQYSSKSTYDDYKQSSTKTSSQKHRRKTPPIRSSSYTTNARAETTPSHQNAYAETDELSTIVDTSELVSLSASSGLQSLRDMFFDENDSHKCYFGVQEKMFDNSYCSHRHGEVSEKTSRISHPSFNSHLEASPILLPDIDPNTYIKVGDISCTSISENGVKDNHITPADPPVEAGKLSPIGKFHVSESDGSDDEITPKEKPLPNKDKKVDFAAGSDVISLTLDEHTEKDDLDFEEHNSREHDIDEFSVASEDIIKAIDRKYLSFTPNTLLCDISNIIPTHQNLVKVEGRHILNKEACLEFMCWLENLNDLYMSIDYGKALNIFRRQESRFKLVLYECLKVAQGCGLDIGFERVAAMAHIAFDVIYSMLPYCDGIKWYSQMVAGARRMENKLAEAYMLLCMGQLMIYGGDCFEAQRHLKNALLIVKQEFMSDQDLYNCIKHLFGFSVTLCDCNKISERESGLIKMTEALVMTRNLYGTNSLETALGRLHIGIAYRSLYEDTALRLEGLDYVERAHEVLEDRLGHHPYMGICVQTLAQYHDDMLNINFNVEYNQALKCYKRATEIHRSAMGGHTFTARVLTQMGDFYHRMADYSNAGRCLTDAYEMSITYCPTDIVSALASFHLGLVYMDDAYPEHDIFRGQNLLTSAANLLSKYGVTYQRATMLQHMGIASEEAGLKHTFYKQESDNIKSVMFGVH